MQGGKMSAESLPVRTRQRNNPHPKSTIDHAGEALSIAKSALKKSQASRKRSALLPQAVPLPPRQNVMPARYRQEEDKGDNLQKLKVEIACDREAVSNSPALPDAMLEDSSSGCGGGVAGCTRGRAPEGHCCKEGRADKEDTSSSTQQQAAEVMEEEAADVDSPEGNVEGLGPAVDPGQQRTRVRRASPGKMPLKPGGPCYRCSVTESNTWRNGGPNGSFPGKPLCNACGVYDSRHPKTGAATGQVATSATPPGKARAGAKGRARAAAKGRAGSIPSTSVGSMEDSMRASVGVSLGDEDGVDTGQGMQWGMANRAAPVSQSDDLQAEQDIAETAMVSSCMQHSPVGTRQGGKRAVSPSSSGPDDNTSKKRARVINLEARAGPTANAAGEVQPFISRSAAEASRRRDQASEELQDGQDVSAGNVVSAEQMAAQVLLGLKTSVDRQESSGGWGLHIGMQPM